MKGASELVTVLMLTGIMITVISSVYFWGTTLISKNKDVVILHNSENFMFDVKNTIESVSKNDGRQEVVIINYGIFTFNGTNIKFVIDTSETKYSIDQEISLGKNQCGNQTGLWTINEPITFCVETKKIDETKFTTTYTLNSIQLNTSSKSYKIELIGEKQIGSEGRIILIEKKGTEITMIENKEIIKTMISVVVV